VVRKGEEKCKNTTGFMNRGGANGKHASAGAKQCKGWLFASLLPGEYIIKLAQEGYPVLKWIKQ
jgi:hypothetical protein